MAWTMGSRGYKKERNEYFCRRRPQESWEELNYFVSEPLFGSYLYGSLKEIVCGRTSIIAPLLGHHNSKFAVLFRCIS